MTTRTCRLTVLASAVALTCLLPSPAAAVDREHQQLEADIRMLQEQASQLQQMLATIGDALKQLNSRIDDQTALERKAFADGKVQMDNLSGDVRIIREKLDDTNVRLSSLGQELEALRSSMPLPGSVAPPQTSSDATPAGPTPPGGTAPGTAVPPPAGAGPSMAGQTPQRLYEQAYGDYSMGQYQLAISGFQALISTFPKSDYADNAQFQIGESYLQSGKYAEAVAAYSRVISDYPSGDQVPNAYYKRGFALENIPGQLDVAKQSYQTAVDKYPDSQAATLAKQRLEGLNKPPAKPAAR